MSNLLVVGSYLLADVLGYVHGQVVADYSLVGSGPFEDVLGQVGVPWEQSQEGIGTPIGVKVPSFANQLYHDTDANTYYRSTGLTSADWVAISGGATPASPITEATVNLNVPGYSVFYVVDGLLAPQGAAGSTVQVSTSQEVILALSQEDADAYWNGPASNASGRVYDLSANEGGLRLHWQDPDSTGDFVFRNDPLMHPPGIISLNYAGEVVGEEAGGPGA